MKYQVQVSGEGAMGLPEQDFEVEAESGDVAVDAARSRLAGLVPLEGGSLDVVVIATEEWTQTAKTPRGGTITETIPPGEVSSFSVRFDPHPNVRAAVEDRLRLEEVARQDAAYRAKVREEILAEIAAGQKTSGKTEVAQ